jgi:hypothetical protein
LNLSSINVIEAIGFREERKKEQKLLSRRLETCDCATFFAQLFSLRPMPHPCRLLFPSRFPRLFIADAKIPRSTFSLRLGSISIGSDALGLARDFVGLLAA